MACLDNFTAATYSLSFNFGCKPVARLVSADHPQTKGRWEGRSCIIASQLIRSNLLGKNKYLLQPHRIGGMAESGLEPKLQLNPVDQLPSPRLVCLHLCSYFGRNFFLFSKPQFNRCNPILVYTWSLKWPAEMWIGSNCIELKDISWRVTI